MNYDDDILHASADDTEDTGLGSEPALDDDAPMTPLPDDDDDFSTEDAL